MKLIGDIWYDISKPKELFLVAMEVNAVLWDVPRQTWHTCHKRYTWQTWQSWQTWQTFEQGLRGICCSVEKPLIAHLLGDISVLASSRLGHEVVVVLYTLLPFYQELATRIALQRCMGHKFWQEERKQLQTRLIACKRRSKIRAFCTFANDHNSSVSRFDVCWKDTAHSW